MPHFNSKRGCLSQVRILIRKFRRRRANPPSFGVLKERKSNVLLGGVNALFTLALTHRLRRCFQWVLTEVGEKNRSEGLK